MWCVIMRGRLDVVLLVKDGGWWRACEQWVQFGIWKISGGGFAGLTVLSACEQENQNEVVKWAKLPLGTPFYFRATLGPQFPNFLPKSIFIRFYLFIFRERGRERERAGEKHQCVVTSHVPPTGNLAHNSGMSPDWESNQQPFGLQAGAQSTEPHQPGPPKFLHPHLLLQTIW